MTHKSKEISKEWQQESNVVKRPTFVRDALTRLQNIANSEQADRAHLLLDSLEAAIPHKYLDSLPPIYLNESDLSSTVFLEWAFPKGRLGFNIEADPNESGWYLLIEQPDGKLLRNWGFLSSFDAKSIVGQMLNQRLL